MAIDVALLTTILESALAAGFAALIGYAKSYFSTDPPQPFEPIKFGDTIVLGIVLGAVAGYFGITVLDASNLLESFGILAAIIYFINAGVTALYRLLKQHFPNLP